MSKVDFLIKQAEGIQNYDPTFERNMNWYVEALLKSKHLENYKYITLSKDTLNFPAIGFIGKLGLDNKWNDIFPTYCRYFALNQATNELPFAVQVQHELVDRVSKGKQVIDTIPADKIEGARASLERMSYILSLVTAGIGLVENMIETIKGSTTSLDYRYSDSSDVFLNYYKK